MSYVLRNYCDEDLAAIAGVVDAARAEGQLDGPARVMQVEERFAWPGFRPTENVFVVEDEGGRVVGFAELELWAGPRQSSFNGSVLVHPHRLRRDVELGLLQRLWKRAQERRRGFPDKPVWFYVVCDAAQPQTANVLESLGLRPVRRSLEMSRPSLEDVRPMECPPGVVVRAYRPAQDDESALEAFNEGFADDWQFVPLKPVEWVHYLGSAAFHPEVSRVASDGEQVVGLCLCFVDRDRIRQLGRRDGYVDSLCVRPAYRRQGVGRALLLDVLQALREAGLESATLDADTDNPSEAVRFYQTVGFRETRRWTTYGKELQ
jgi:mycothiol synthase